MNFEQSTVQQNTDSTEDKFRRNKLLELGDPIHSADIKEKIEERIQKTSKTDDQREKRMKIHLYKFEVIHKVKTHYEEIWGKMNRSLIGKDGVLSSDQQDQRNRFVGNIDKDEIQNLLEQWQSDWEEAASNEADEKEKNDLYLYIDALQELKGDIANW